MMLINDSNATIIEPWFIPFDIIRITSGSISVFLASIYLILIITRKKCHTVPMMLVGNSCLAELFFGSNMLATALFTYQNDLRQIQYYNSFCIVRGYLGYVTTVLQNYSYLILAVYRYVTVVYPGRLYWRTVRSQLIPICLMWIFGIVCPLPYLLTGQIQYQIDDQICQAPFRFSITAIYNASSLYIIPILSIAFVYFKLVRYVQRMSRNPTIVNTLLRAKRELKMVQQIVILVMGVATIGLPYAIFAILGFFTMPPKYHFRIAYIFVDVSLTFVMIYLFKITEPLQSFLLRKNQIHPNMERPAFT